MGTTIERLLALATGAGERRYGGEVVSRARASAALRTLAAADGADRGRGDGVRCAAIR
jgi:hypothetical protein